MTATIVCASRRRRTHRQDLAAIFRQRNHFSLQMLPHLTDRFTLSNSRERLNSLRRGKKMDDEPSPLLGRYDSARAVRGEHVAASLQILVEHMTITMRALLTQPPRIARL
jgi:hypothetical protein